VGIDWYRDLIICISGVVATAALILIAALLSSLHRKIGAALASMEATSERAKATLASIQAASDKVNSTLDSMDALSASVRGLSSYVREEIVEPTVQLAALAQGMRQGIDLVGSYFRRKEGESHG
jgi:methyl-accepting chemotaxis protein